MRVLFLTDRSLIELIQPVLKAEGVLIEVAEQLTQADYTVQTHRCDVVVLERDRFGDFSYSRLLRWRHAGLKAHVLVVLPRDCDSADKVEALDAGADGYLLRPFCIEELRARFRALRRRDDPSPTGSILRIHDLEIDTAGRIARRGGRLIQLTSREFDLLKVLAQHQGRVVSRAVIREQLYNSQHDDGSNVIDVYIRYLRNKIDKGFETPLILTRWGQGYQLRSPDVSAESRCGRPPAG